MKNCRTGSFARLLSLIGLVTVWWSPVIGQNGGEGVVELSPFQIVAGERSLLDQLSVGAYLGESALQRHLNADITSVLRQVPGVYICEEDGMGMFSHISIRGVTPERINSVTMTEDGIPLSPAPYSLPSLFFNPSVTRMSGVEIHKSGEAMSFGPNTVGGVLDYQTTPIPAATLSHASLSYGSYNELIGHVWHGGVRDLGDQGKIGYLVEGLYQRSDGYRTISPAPAGLSDPDDRGFQRIEPMIKLSWELPTELLHRFDFKYSYNELEVRDPVVGLSEVDFRADPYRLYPVTRFDRVSVGSHRTSISHVTEPRDNLQLITTGYYHDFSREWIRLNGIIEPEHDLVDIVDVLGPEFDDHLLAIARGQAPGILRVRNNLRDLRAYGVQSTVLTDFEIGATDHRWQAGIRYHFDEADSFHHNVDYEQFEDGTISDHVVIGEPGSVGDRIQRSRAWAVYAKDEIDWGRWMFVPGIRAEWIEQEYLQDQRRHEGEGEPMTSDGGLSVVRGGVALSYEFNPRWTGLVAWHSSYGIPNPRATLVGGLNEEISYTQDLGVRYQDSERGLQAQAVLFYTGVDGMIVGEHPGSGGSSISQDFGNYSARGLELLVSYDIGKAQDWSVTFPARMSLTLTDVRMHGSPVVLEDEHGDEGENGDGHGGMHGGGEGHFHTEIYYTPDYQFAGEVGVEHQKFGAYLRMNYLPATTAIQAFISEDSHSVAGDVVIDIFFTAELSVRYFLNERTTIFGGVRNILGREYASNREIGIRPGAPRLFHVGVEMTF